MSARVAGRTVASRLSRSSRRASSRPRPRSASFRDTSPAPSRVWWRRAARPPSTPLVETVGFGFMQSVEPPSESERCTDATTSAGKPLAATNSWTVQGMCPEGSRCTGRALPSAGPMRLISRVSPVTHAVWQPRGIEDRDGSHRLCFPRAGKPGNRNGLPRSGKAPPWRLPCSPRRTRRSGSIRSGRIARGPAEALALTENTQPAVMTASVAAWVAARDAGLPKPDFVAGHSLGNTPRRGGRCAVGRRCRTRDPGARPLHAGGGTAG